MDNDNGISLFTGGTIHLDNLQQSSSEEDIVNEEEERAWNLDLQKAVQNAFDDLDDSQDHSCLFSYGSTNECGKEEQSSTTSPHNDSVTPVWSEASEDERGSGHFPPAVPDVAQGTSPTQFHLNLNGVVSRSPDSASDDEQISVQGSFPLREGQVTITHSDFLSAETSEEQLQLLYEARGRELDRISEELAQLKVTADRNLASLRRQLATATTDKETLLAGETQMKVLLTESEARIRSLSADVREKDERLEALEAENKKLNQALNTADGTVSSLETRVAELQSVDCLAKSRRAHENFVKKLQGCHQDETDALKRKLKLATGRLEEVKREAKSLEDDLATARRSKDLALQEKAEVICQLNSDLDTARQHIEALLRRQEPRRAESPAKDVATNCVCGGRGKKELETYDMLTKLGLFNAVLPQAETSADQLKLGKALSFNDSSLNSQQPAESNRQTTQEVNISEKLKQEVFQSLLTNKMYRDKIKGLNECIVEKEKLIDRLRHERKSSMEAPHQREDEQQKLLLTEENCRLKRELVLLFHDFENARQKGRAMIEALGKAPSDNTLSLPPNDYTLLVIHEFTTSVENCTQVSSQIWEDLRKENLELVQANRCLLISQLEKVAERLKAFRAEMQTKALPDLSDTTALKQLLDSFVQTAQEIEGKTKHTLHDSAQLRKEIWSLKLNLEKTKTDNETLTATAEDLQKQLDWNKKDKVRTVESCKTTYLQFHETAVSKLREELQNEYNGIVTALKNELDKISGQLCEVQTHYIEVCREKDELAERYQEKNSNHGNEEPHQGSEQLKTKVIENGEPLGHILESMSSSDKADLNEARVKVAELSEQLLAMEELGRRSAVEKAELVSQLKDLESVAKSEAEQGERKEAATNTDGVADRKNPASDFSLSRIMETVDMYKKMNQDLREEKDRLKDNYEKQVQELKRNMEAHTRDVMTHTRAALEGEIGKEAALLKQKLQLLSSATSRLEQEKAKVQYSFNQQIKDLTEEIQTRESRIEYIRESYERQLNELMASVHHIRVDNCTLQERIKNLENTVTKQNEKYLQLKRKFVKIKTNFDKYRTWADERANQLIAETSSSLQQKCQKWDTEIDGIKQWLARCRMSLTESVSRVIKELEAIPERAIPHPSIEPQIKALSYIQRWILNLDIRDKNSSPQTQYQPGVIADEPVSPAS